MLVVIGVFLLTFTGGVFSNSKPTKCKNEEPTCLKREYYTKNNPICVRTCANRREPYKVTCEPYTGCVCENGYVRKYEDGTGPCIRETKCASNRICPKYERYAKNALGCPKTCGNRRVPVNNLAGACPPKKGCVCDAGHVRKFDNATGPCIRVTECPPIPTECGINEVPTSCDIKCPPQSCDSIYSIYDCPKTECEPGCICRDNYLRNSENICIPSEECSASEPLTCGPNEVASDCAITCPPQSCESIYTNYSCSKRICSPGCNCIDGYLRNGEGKCIPSDQCFNDGSGCKGDANATQVACGSACEPTCAQPDTNRPCVLLCKVNACKCDPGYILTERDGVCVEPEDCPGGSPTCGANKTYIDCKVSCQSDYCPIDDSRGVVACALPDPCPGGCACENGYLMLSNLDKRCVLPSECPPVECTRPNEIWDPNPSNCFEERCGSKCSNEEQSTPRCVCKPGFARNDSDVCVPESECLTIGCNGDPNAELSDCLTGCPRTCEDQEDDPLCPVSCDKSGCVCKSGFVLNYNGKCIKPEECRGPRGCNGDPNAKYGDCPSSCPNSCDNQGRNISCIAECGPAGCDCKPGFVLNDKSRCIKPKDCPGGSPVCPVNQTYVDCTSCGTNYCPINDNQGVLACSIAYPCPGGCVCSSGYLALSYDDPQCILASECPPVTCTRPNEVWDPKPSTCFYEGCRDRGSDCDYIGEDKPRCICKEGYYRNEDNICVPESECPPFGCNGDSNATFTTCRSACPTTCANKDKGILCPAVCKGTGCQCNPGYVLNDDGLCIRPEDCPATIGCNGDPNAEFSNCLTGCPRTCEDQEDDPLCPVSCDKGGCVCKQGFVLNYNGKCIKPEECRGPRGCNGDPNAKYSDCPSSCPNSCDNQGQNISCIAGCGPVGCDCKPGFVLNDKGQCIKPKDCPGGSPVCPVNQTYVDCTACATNFCPINDDHGISSCSIAYPCPGGCVCSSGYLALSFKDPQCILASECPPVTCTRPNEVWQPKPSTCFFEGCGDRGSDCDYIGQDKPRCICIEGYYRNEENICVPESECPQVGCKGDRNATISGCLSGCPKTCNNKDDDIMCAAVCQGYGCACTRGYVLNDDGICIKPEDCPVEKGCKGDPNAEFSVCPSACPTTCANKDQSASCISECGPYGCKCKEGFVLNANGLCIKPEECPGGSPTCSANQTYVDCTSCANDYCPTSDFRGFVACSIAYPCPGGCVCSSGYLALSYEDQRCVLASECPPVECTRPNEVWDPKPSTCYSEKCGDRSIFCDIASDKPRCVCKEGYYRNDDDICVPEAECPSVGCLGDRNATFRGCLSPCRTTCANKDENLSCITVCAGAGCDCNPGYVYDNAGRCIKAEDCPAEPQCNGDRNATFQSCPSPCQATCDKPDVSGACSDVCAPEKCVCKPGYLLSQETNGQCVEPKDCPGGIPSCPANETYDYCKGGCPTDYCPSDDSLAYVACDLAFPCRGGCICNDGFLRLSYTDTTCVKAAECPPVECTRPNEIWEPSPSDCLRERCDDRNRECGYPIPQSPKCICKPGYFRNRDDICVPASECPTLGCGGDPNASFNECLSACPTTCANKDRNVACIDVCRPAGCVCNPGYVLSEDNGVCVKIEDCPAEPQCNGDRNATFQSCPSPCQATCDKPEGSVTCIEVCAPDGCVCKPGYLLSQENNGQCIEPTDCPGGSPTCPENETYAYCKVGCPTNYCPTDESSNLVICDPIFPCPGGCICKPGFLRLNYTDDRCVPVSECPPVECTKPNEVWAPSPPKCLRERCDNRNLECDFPYQQPPKCICKPGFFRNQEDICVPASECAAPLPVCGLNEVAVPCRTLCPPQNCEISYTDYACTEKNKICEPGCDCLPDHLRNGSGICIPNNDCPSAPLPVCGLNEVAVPCRTVCPPQNCEISYTDYACTEETKICEPGCDCLPDHLRNGSGICIPNNDCPYPSTPACGINEIARDCRRVCPPQTCLSKYALFRCKENITCEPGCDCVANYLRDSSGKCIPSDKCPPLCTVTDECKRTCESPNPPNCPYLPPEENINGCDCKMGYVLSKIGGECIKIEDCPSDLSCNGDINARPKQCPLPCPSTCESPNAVPCKRKCDPIGCECKPGFILSNITGQCILPDKCPGGNPCGSSGRFVFCKNDCPRDYCPTDDSRGIIECDPLPECLSGCICNLNHKKKSFSDPTCIVSSDCPAVQCSRPNEEWDSCPSACLREKCEDIHNQPTVCNTLVLNCEPSCVCKKNHFRNSTDICIPAKECPAPLPVCGLNEVAVPCRTVCPPQNCEISYTDYACTEETKICEPGCDCLPDHLRNGSGICIPNNDCPYPSTPVCGINEIARDCRRVCPPQTCLSKYALFKCKENITCEAGCDCVANYLRDSSGKCIPSDKCPPLCTVTDECKRTCESPNPPNCPYLPPEENINGCDCKLGYVLSKIGGECIKIEDCPSDLGCNGDINAGPKQCPLPCPSTCESPNAVPCKRKCDPIGCECKPGFILSNITGQCILPDKCPGGNPCGSSGRFVFCKNDCPRDYCPTDDSRGIIECDPLPECLSGCICNLNHKKKSFSDPTCIVSSDCPPVQCSRPNEEWDSCPSACLQEKCEDIHNQPTVCNTLVLNCEPSCVCKNNHFRNATDICIPAKECPC